MINTESLESKASEYAQLLAKELENLSDYKSENEMEIFLSKNIIPEFLNHDINGERIMDKMEVVHTVFLKSVIEEKRLSVSGAVSLMDVNSINWMIELVQSVESYIDKPERKTYLYKQVNRLKDILLSELGERSQLFEGELMELLNMKPKQLS